MEANPYPRTITDENSRILTLGERAKVRQNLLDDLPRHIITPSDEMVLNRMLFAQRDLTASMYQARVEKLLGVIAELKGRE